MASTSNQDKNEMSFLDHLEELRWHLVRAAIAILVFAIAAFAFKSFIFNEVIFGPKTPGFWTYEQICNLSSMMGGDTFCFDEMPFILINTEMSGQFSTHMWVSIVAGIIVAFPYVVFEMWRFVKPGLHENERKNGSKVIFFTALLFIMGVLFGYYLIAPLSVQFFGTYTVDPSVANQIRLSSYISMVTSTTLASGLLFELPVLAYFFSVIGLLTPEWMRKYRRHAVIVVLVLSAIITPPDILSQILVTVPIMILYEVSISLSSRVNKRKKASA
ncbi:MAG: twin-arginine translocase subunit TatC [Bacteroidetes bacterium]|uniref:Sec-independent protein translocase protein TatC n=1 Tax=Phaeocystidibacter marisrubri TaxID=1577780 RepID=A0A6L3ZHY2_9FLAO|nr:twin-arginine translocase subunit TatC [Phaeocystidibacter marisrubri]KAB2817233.1 twin-arginine translocase subunit TatC [Phaeocystidibacter marisrubri]TNE28344.1 MAG: twin-arginine translocase subunit TatC [Bacteroidota bacterium]